MFCRLRTKRLTRIVAQPVFNERMAIVTTSPNAGASAPRLPLLDRPDDPIAIEILETIRARTGRILNLHRMMAHAPAMMKASYDTAMAIRHDLSLTISHDQKELEPCRHR